MTAIYPDNGVLTDDDDQAITQNSAISETTEIEWHGDLLEIFLKNQILLGPAMPVLATLLAFTALNWAGAAIVLPWLFAAIGAGILQIYLCHLYFRRPRSKSRQRDWIGMISASELLQGAIWVAPLFTLWPTNNSLGGSFLLAAVMAVSVVRFMVVNNFMPVLIAGTGIMTVGAALRCISGDSSIYLALAGIIIMLEVFFLFIARQLQETARDLVIYRKQKDALIASLKVARDVAENEKQKAESANKAKSVFLANMSHELRTPLNAILGFSEVLERELFGPLAHHAYKDYAGDIHSSGRYLLGLINDILDVSRIEAGRREVRDEPVHLAETFDHAHNLIKANAAKKSIAVTLHAPQNLPRLMADFRAVNQIVINLLTNAVKFTPDKGTVTVSARQNGLGCLEISVKDDGPGIPQNEIASALSAFSRGKSAVKKAVEGAGLGLSIVKGIMDLHGGKVRIVSASGQGTEIICEFPASRTLSGPRGFLYSAAENRSETQDRLITITG